MRKIFYLLVVSVVFAGCSDNKQTNATQDSAPKSLAVTERVKSEVPRDRLIYSALGNGASLSLNELVALYKKDISTAGSDYLTNLKNMWITVLKDRLHTEGTEEQKLFFINEQAALPDNLAHFIGFYNLLAASKLLGRAEKEAIANTYYEKNLKAIESIKWRQPDEEKNKKTELVYAKRTFQILLNSQKQV